jgi:hypothetical protein
MEAGAAQVNSQVNSQISSQSGSQVGSQIEHSRLPISAERALRRSAAELRAPGLNLLSRPSRPDPPEAPQAGYPCQEISRGEQA